MIQPQLADAVLARLGVPDPEPTFDGLAAIYLRWCHEVPFDNLRKRRWLSAGASGQPPGIDAEDFFETFLEHGTGGTCWPTSNAFTELLLHVGFDARRAASSMLPFPEITNRPNHGTTIVRLGTDQLLVDTSMLTEVPLPLLGEASVGGSGITSARVEPHGRLWRVWWKPWRGSADEMLCEMEDDSVDVDLYQARYDASRGFSPFNTTLYARKGHRDGIRLVIGSELIDVDRAGTVTRTDINGRRAHVLVAELGYSHSMVAAVPADDPGPPPPSSFRA